MHSMTIHLLYGLELCKRLLHDMHCISGINRQVLRHRWLGIGRCMHSSWRQAAWER